MVHFASYTNLVDPLEEPQFELPLPQGNPASLCLDLFVVLRRVQQPGLYCDG